MAEVVKRLRPRIVVPICVGSNPIFRPILNLLSVNRSKKSNMTDFYVFEILKDYTEYPLDKLAFEAFV